MKSKNIPTVRIVRPSKRPFQLRYFCPDEQREIRISTGTRDEDQAEQKKKDLEAKLRLGIDAKPRNVTKGPSMRWEEFRGEYSRLKVATFRSENAKYTAEIRLDVCESIVLPRTLGDMADPTNLAMLQAELLTGAKSRLDKRSPRTVESYVTTLQAALNWAHKPMRWLPGRCEFEALDTETDETLKGRPITEREFLRLLKGCRLVCSDKAESWQFLLRGLWESGLRLDEALHVSWTDENQIQPLKTRHGGYLLRIPARLQKNRKTQEIPTTPAFGALLDGVPHDKRIGWVFSPLPLRKWPRRLTAKQAGRVITKIGRRARLYVNAQKKPASAHDLRRSFGNRMADAGLPPRDLQAIMRHRSLTTTEKFYLRHRAVEQSERIAQRLKQAGTYLGTSHADQKKKVDAEST